MESKKEKDTDGHYKIEWEIKEDSNYNNSDYADSNTDYSRPENMFLLLKEKRINTLSSQQIIQYHQFIEKRAKNIFCELLKRKDLADNKVYVVPGNEENFYHDQNMDSNEPYLADLNRNKFSKKVFKDQESTQKRWREGSSRR